MVLLLTYRQVFLSATMQVSSAFPYTQKCDCGGQMKNDNIQVKSCLPGKQFSTFYVEKCYLIYFGQKLNTYSKVYPQNLKKTLTEETCSRLFKLPIWRKAHASCPLETILKIISVTLIGGGGKKKEKTYPRYQMALNT